MFGFVIGYVFIITGIFEETMSKSFRFSIEYLRKPKNYFLIRKTNNPIKRITLGRIIGLFFYLGVTYASVLAVSLSITLNETIPKPATFISEIRIEPSS